LRIRKDKMVAAIDHIVSEQKKRQEAWEKAVVTWEKERRQEWLRVERPKWKKLQALIAQTGRTEPITAAQLIELFPGGRYGDGWRMTPFIPDLTPNSPITLNSGQKVSRPTGYDITQMEAMKGLLDAVDDDVVSDTVLAKLGVKNVTPIFRAAVELGGLVS
jgi:hypothetical protein